VLCRLIDDGAMRTKIAIAGIARYEGMELRLEWHVAGDSKCRALLRGHGGQSCTHFCDFCDATKDSGVLGKPRCNDQRRVTWAPDLMGPLLAAADKVWPSICRCHVAALIGVTNMAAMMCWFDSVDGARALFCWDVARWALVI
jgi:hypothetical protein